MSPSRCSVPTEAKWIRSDALRGGAVTDLRCPRTIDILGKGRELVMKKMILAACVFIPSLALAQAVARPTGLQGDYVEVRSASVFAGACHFNGENVTTGRDAMLAWNVES